MKAPVSTPPMKVGGGEEDGEKRGNKRGAPVGLMDGFSPVSPPRIFWNSRRRSAKGRSLELAMEEESLKSDENSKPEEQPAVTTGGEQMEEEPYLSDRRRAMFEPLDPPDPSKRMRAEDLLPPPDFDSMSYPKGWLVGKKRKLVNVDVVESMRRIAVQEMNRKDREIDGLNEQLEEDGRCLERLQLQLLEERSKRANVDREKAMLEKQVAMLMEMLQEPEEGDHQEEP